MNLPEADSHVAEALEDLLDAARHLYDGPRSSLRRSRAVLDAALAYGQACEERDERWRDCLRETLQPFVEGNCDVKEEEMR